MKVECHYCGIWFDPAENVLACYCPHCDRWSCADCYMAASLAWYEKLGLIGELIAAFHKAEQETASETGSTHSGEES
jgi:hypothetical protein